MNKMQTENRLEPRILAARAAIAAGGGVTLFARRLSKWIGVEVSRKRVEQWRERGIPDEWTTIVEHLTDVERERLNPHLYDVRVAHRVIHRKLTTRKGAFSVTSSTLSAR